MFDLINQLKRKQKERRKKTYPQAAFLPDTPRACILEPPLPTAVALRLQLGGNSYTGKWALPERHPLICRFSSATVRSIAELALPRGKEPSPRHPRLVMRPPGPCARDPSFYAVLPPQCSTSILTL